MTPDFVYRAFIRGFHWTGYLHGFCADTGFSWMGPGRPGGHEIVPFTGLTFPG